MVMIFRSKKALDYLLQTGSVVTFRTKKRYYPNKEWVTDRRGGKKIADVAIYYITEVEISDRKRLEAYVYRTGFDSVDEWIAEIRKLHGDVKYGHLYLVKIMEYIDLSDLECYYCRENGEHTQVDIKAIFTGGSRFGKDTKKAWRENHIETYFSCKYHGAVPAYQKSTGRILLYPVELFQFIVLDELGIVVRGKK